MDTVDLVDAVDALPFNSEFRIPPSAFAYSHSSPVFATTMCLFQFGDVSGKSLR